MKLKIATIILFLICVGLGVMLVLRQKETHQLQKTTDETSVALSTVSNQWKKTSKDLSDAQAANAEMAQIVKVREGELTLMTNKLTETKAQLEKAEADAKAKEQAAQTELAKREARITELEGQRDDLNKRMGALTNLIGDLQKQITETERKLSVSEGDREFLLKELKRMQTEKAELERQFNDLKALKTQVSKLKEELAIARRLEFIRAGVFSGLKGAEMLMRKPSPPSTPKAPTNFNLNVEFKQDGGVKVIPSTNAPSTNPPAPAPK
jgi:predicted  nucleic acid-binding Zn-ribbon protein